MSGWRPSRRGSRARMNRIAAKVAVIIPVWNDAEALERTLSQFQALDSAVLAQLEVIVADGASQDETLAVLGSFAGIVSHVDSQQDGGVYDAMNRGVSNVSAPWIWVMGAGDIPTGTRLETRFGHPHVRRKRRGACLRRGLRWRTRTRCPPHMDSALGQRHALAEHHAPPRPHRSKFMVEVTSISPLTACLAITLGASTD